MSGVSSPSTAAPKHRELGLSDHEYELIRAGLDRAPNDLELAMFSLLWSEHCAYKHSKKLLRGLPTEGPRVVMGPGENAGAVALADGWSIAFKVESHNHPSAVEPFQGAATGVGGILRDVFALGARPIAILDSLRFGELTSERSRFLFDGVVSGIGHYGNSIGIATIGGEVAFEAPYEHNCLVNAMAIGLARTDRMVRAAAVGIGNPIVLLGASTGRDGIGGASVLASAELEAGDEKRPTVQIGDPFEEKKVMELCLEALDRGLFVSLQDLGAAGLTSAASEMASAGAVGVEIDVAKVPLRNPDLAPFEVMVSESQERMLAIVAPDRLGEVEELADKWQSGFAVIGEVIAERVIRVFDGPEVVGEMPVDLLVDDCPLYDLAPLKPKSWDYPNRATLQSDDPAAILLSLLAAPTIASKRWVYEQYDSIVGSRTVRRPEQAEAAVLLIEQAGRAIAAAIDGNGRRVACDPYLGTIEAVLECAANLACVGAEPLGLTNCLNFPNPEKPTAAWQLTESVRGLADACRALEIPVVGGNVSLYNETEAGPIYPTPVVGLVGEVPDPTACPGSAAEPGDQIYLIGTPNLSLRGGELAKQRGELGFGLGEIDLAGARATLDSVRRLARSGSARALRDISDGGVACALAELAIASGTGLEADLPTDRDDCERAGLFGEGPGGFICAVAADQALPNELVATPIGELGGRRFVIRCGSLSLDLDPAEIEAAWRSLPDQIGARA